MTSKPQEDSLGKDLLSGANHYRAFIGPPGKYDLVSAMMFNLLTFLGLREHHSLLDIGCGSLRGGKLFVPYLLPGRYFGIEPERWLIEEGLKKELGKDLVRIKQPIFSNDKNFTMSIFNQKFDFILAQSIFSHTSQLQIRRCLSEAKKVMRPTSIFAATFVKGEKNYSGNKWVYPGCVTYTLDHITSIIKEQGLVGKAVDWFHPNQQTWLVIVNPGKEKNIPVPNNFLRLSFLENELKILRERLSKIEGHPYVRLGLEIRRLVRRIKQ
jgi:SAM-dependent methyltransferase